MRNRIFKSVISVVLILAVLITSDALIWSAFAAESHVVGIDNHVMTTSAEPGSTKYIIRFLKHKDNNDGFNQIRLPSELTLNGGKSLVPTDSAEEGSAYIFLGANESIAFNRTPAFIDFIRDKNIDGFTVEYRKHQHRAHRGQL